VAENVIHYCVPNMPGVLGRTATHALNNATWPHVQRIAALGAETAIARSRPLARGVVTLGGRVLAQPNELETAA
jgi:alanine dehydrogenase